MFQKIDKYIENKYLTSIALELLNEIKCKSHKQQTICLTYMTCKSICNSFIFKILMSKNISFIFYKSY